MEYVLDSFAWMEYFGGNRNYLQYIENEGGILPITPSVVLTEVIRSLVRKKTDRKEINACIKFISDKSIVLPVGKENAISAGYLAEETGLHFSDALIYSFTGPKRKVVTGDPHFQKLENVEFIENKLR